MIRRARLRAQSAVQCPIVQRRIRALRLRTRCPVCMFPHHLTHRILPPPIRRLPIRQRRTRHHRILPRHILHRRTTRVHRIRAHRITILTRRIPTAYRVPRTAPRRVHIPLLPPVGVVGMRRPWEKLPMRSVVG